MKQEAKRRSSSNVMRLEPPTEAVDAARVELRDAIMAKDADRALRALFSPAHGLTPVELLRYGVDHRPSPDASAAASNVPAGPVPASDRPSVRIGATLCLAEFSARHDAEEIMKKIAHALGGLGCTAHDFCSLHRKTDSGRSETLYRPPAWMAGTYPVRMQWLLELAAQQGAIDVEVDGGPCWIKAGDFPLLNADKIAQAKALSPHMMALVIAVDDKRLPNSSEPWLDCMRTSGARLEADIELENPAAAALLRDAWPPGRVDSLASILSQYIKDGVLDPNAPMSTSLAVRHQVDRLMLPLERALRVGELAAVAALLKGGADPLLLYRDGNPGISSAQATREVLRTVEGIAASWEKGLAGARGLRPEDAAFFDSLKMRVSMDQYAGVAAIDPVIQAPGPKPSRRGL